MKKYNRHLFTIFIFLIGSLAAFSQSKLVDKVVARVGSEYILLSDVEDEYSYYKSQDPTVSTDVKCIILDNMIAQKLVIYYAKIDSVEISDAEVEQQLDYRFESILRQMNGDEAFFEEYYGASVQEMKDRYRDDQKHKILAEKMQHELMSEIDITPKEVETFYNSIPTDSLPYFKSELEISEIVAFPKVNSVSRQKALDKANEIRDKILLGEMSFEDAARKYSMDPGSAVRGGDLGFAKRGVFVPEFEAAAFSLTDTTVTDIIESEFGFHFMKLIERRGNSVRVRHILIKPEITKADLTQTQNLLDSIRLLIMNDSITFETAVRKYSDKNMPSYANGGRVKNYNSNNTFFASDDLDPDTYFAVSDLKPGEISKAIEFPTPDGQKAFRLIQLNSKSKPHRANLKDDFDKIAEYAKESKKNEYFLKWLKKRRSETFIQTDPIFEDCDLGPDSMMYKR